MIDMREFIASIAGVTDRDELLGKIAVIPDEEVRVVLALITLSWNKSVEINEVISARQNKRIRELEEQIKDLERKHDQYGDK